MNQPNWEEILDDILELLEQDLNLQEDVSDLNVSSTCICHNKSTNKGANKANNDYSLDA